MGPVHGTQKLVRSLCRGTVKPEGFKLMEEAYFKCQSSLATVYQRNLAETSGSLTNCTSVTNRTRTRSTPSGGPCSNPSLPVTPLPPTERPAPRQLCILPPVNFPL